jgi:hypothetical protein
VAVVAETVSDPLATLVDPNMAIEADVVIEEITVTALTGETIPLVPPQATDQADPGALGRWFAQVSGPVENLLSQNAPLLNKLASASPVSRH